MEQDNSRHIQHKLPPGPGLSLALNTARCQMRIELRPQPYTTCYVIACPRMSHILSSPTVYYATTCPRLFNTRPMQVPSFDKIFLLWSKTTSATKIIFPPAIDLSLTLKTDQTPSTHGPLTPRDSVSKGVPKAPPSTAYHVVACSRLFNIRSMRVSSFAIISLRPTIMGNTF